MSEDKKNIKKLTSHQKDLPRYKVVNQYEDIFKKNYQEAIKSGLELMLKRAKKIVKDNV